MIAAHVLSAYLAACAPSIGASTIAAIVKVESGGNPWAINDNTAKRSFSARSYDEALRIASTLIGLGHSVDLGLAQINSRNLGHLGMSVGEVLEPCRNLMAAAQILTECYLPAARRFGPGQRALVRALGCYNTGSLHAGRDYIARVLSAALVRHVAHESESREARLAVAAPREAAPIVLDWTQEKNWRVF